MLVWSDYFRVWYTSYLQSSVLLSKRWQIGSVILTLLNNLKRLLFSNFWYLWFQKNKWAFKTAWKKFTYYTVLIVFSRNQDICTHNFERSIIFVTLYLYPLSLSYRSLSDSFLMLNYLILVLVAPFPSILKKCCNNFIKLTAIEKNL